MISSNSHDSIDQSAGKTLITWLINKTLSAALCLLFELFQTLSARTFSYRKHQPYRQPAIQRYDSGT